jgi:SpoVK/Ycf46/Vps4 family AAA+-type ATPase
MPSDKSVVDALLLALENEPNNTAIRLHLGTLYLDSAEYGPAFEQAQMVLALEPANIDALNLAAAATEKLGDLTKAASYRKLVNALSDAPPPAARSFARDDWADVLEENTDPIKRQPLRESVGPSEPYADDDQDDAGFVVDVEYSDLRLSDVAGLEQVKRRLNLAFLSPLKNPEMMQIYSKSLRGGLLLYGAPGCGKTFIARAVAGELGARFISVGLSDVLDMWIGSSEKNIHSIFERARRNAPCVLFFDELDALGRKRSLTRNQSHGAINQLLSELDGMNQANDGVFVLAATNHPWDVDTALRRPGRLDRTLLVLPPDEPARMGVLEFHLRGRPVDGSVDPQWIAKHTKEFSGADIAHLVESAVEFAMEESLTTGNVRSINQSDFKKALRDVKPSTRPWFEIAKNYALFANDGGIYDDLIEYLKELRMI